MSERHTFGEWNQIQPQGVEVLDPDGWDRSAASDELTTRTYTEDEFLARAMRSTIQPHNGWDTIIWPGDSE